MKRPLLAALLALGTASLPFAAQAQVEQQALVDRATLAAQDILLQNNPDAPNLLRRARAVMICPRVFRAGFIVGGSGGDCVLVARGGAGSWSSPAFYTIGTGSVGFQIGMQDSEVMMMILTDRGLNAVLDNQFKIGADASVAFVTVGAGVQGATTAAVGADIVAFERSRGLFAGITLSGSLLGSSSAWDRAYYGRDVGPRQIVVDMQVNNPAANPLRELLMRYGAPAAAPYPAARGYAPPPAGYAPPPAGGYAPAAPAQYAPGQYAPGSQPPGYAPALPAYSPQGAAGYGAQGGYQNGYGGQPGGGAYTPGPAPVQAQSLPPPR